MDFMEPRRQHPLGVLILAAQFLWRFGQQAWPLLIGLSLGENVWRNALLGGSAFLLLVGGSAVLYYLRFKYGVEGDNLVVEKGVLHRERLQIPFERIQTIQLYQGPIQQVFGLTGLRVDTAGSSATELQLVAIRKDAATALQAMLRSRGAMKADPKPVEEASTAGADSQETEGDAAFSGTPLVSLSLTGLIKVGLSQNHLRNAFAGFALFSYLLGNRPEAVSAWIETIPPLLAVIVGMTLVLLIVPGILLFLLLGVIVSVVSSFLRYFRLESSIGKEGLNLAMGLLKRNTFQVPFARIHLTVWRSNWIRRKLGFETLEVRQAQAQQAMGALRISLPAMEHRHRAVFEAAVYPDLNRPPHFEVAPAGRLRWILWIGAMSPCALFWMGWGAWSAGLATAVWGGLSFWTTSRRYGSLKLKVHGDTVVMEKGWFWRRRILLRLAQIQGVEWERHLLLERRAIGHLVFHTAAGARTFKYLHKDAGTAIMDFALNQHHARSSRA